MAYFDLSSSEITDRRVTASLGYKKIFSSKELPVLENLDSNERCIVRSGEIGMLRRAIRRNNVAGIMIKDNELLRIAVEEAAENEKTLFISLHDILCSDTKSRLRNIYRARGLMAFAMRSKASISLVSLADSEAGLISTMQMLGMAKFLGASEENAKRIVSRLGEIQ